MTEPRSLIAMRNVAMAAYDLSRAKSIYPQGSPIIEAYKSYYDFCYKQYTDPFNSKTYA